MKLYIYRIVTVISMGCFVAFSEFFRNDILFSKGWLAYYNSNNMIKPYTESVDFESVLWSLFYVIFVFTIAGRYSFRRTLFITFCSGFLLQWFTFGDADFSALKILIPTTPLFFLETIILVGVLYLFRKWELKHFIAKHLANEAS